MLTRMIGFVSTADAEKARGFYGDVLGFRLMGDDQYALVFDANGTMLRVTAVERVDPAPYTVLGWMVADIEAALAELLAHGVEPVRYDGMDQDATGVWRSPSGARIAWLRDPDGNTLSLTQRS